MTHPDAPDEFERALQRRTKLLPQFETEIEGPDASIDRIVLARARAPFDAPRDAEPRYHRAPRWALPVALAATLLLSFTLVLHMSARDPALTAPTTSEAAVAAKSAAAAADAVRPADAAAGVVPDEAAESAADSVALSAAPEAQAPAAPMIMPAPPPPAPAMQAPTAAVAADRAQRATAEIANMAAERHAAADAAGTESAAAWLARIEALRAGGDLDAARRELAAFRRQYPDAALPEALRGL